MQHPSINRLMQAGISGDDATALRRISMTLHRWHELECGNGDDNGSWCIVRGRRHATGFEHDDSGTPFMEHVPHRGAPYYARIADRETGARKRLRAIMARYPGFQAYVQTDPRGCALYVLRPDDVKPGDDISCIYTRGIAVFK